MLVMTGDTCAGTERLTDAKERDDIDCDDEEEGTKPLVRPGSGEGAIRGDDKPVA